MAMPRFGAFTARSAVAATAAAMALLASPAAGVGIDAGADVIVNTNVHLNVSSYGSSMPVSYFNVPKDCPPCFNCLLPAFDCGQYAECSSYDGTCKCPPGWAGKDCLEPLCGSLADDDRPMRGDDKQCVCKDGWTGINCNVCTDDRACDALMETKDNGVCYQTGDVVKNNFQQCDVTNRQILKMLGGKLPQVTFTCDRESAACDFQFWVDQRESFYCHLTECESSANFDQAENHTRAACASIECSCVPDRMLCGEGGSVDLTDYLREEINGPATFECRQHHGANACTFDEPSMNELISSIFGDPSIFLECRSGECLYVTEVPGYRRPVPRINTPLIAAVIASASLFVVAVLLLTWYLARRQQRHDPSVFSDDEDDESVRLMANHKPATLFFRDVGYRLQGRAILDGIQGLAAPGEVTAIMGASGAGKTTFLDILARKNKRGIVTGGVLVNGEVVADADYRAMIGFVDQEDAMLPTLTVHETILTSALLRLPRDMSRAAKEQRVVEVEKQLGIFHIRDSLVGADDGRAVRGISGGEKRRVGIACELVTSPSILFLDEPTSGLDAYNAYNVVECLVTLAKTYRRTVIFTIHQPRSNIAALFDRLILLARGRAVYSGPFSQCHDYFDRLGYVCPPGFNIADYVVDLTMHVEGGSGATFTDDNADEADEDGPRIALDDHDATTADVDADADTVDEHASLPPSSTRAVKSIASMSAASIATESLAAAAEAAGPASASAETSALLRPRPHKRYNSIRALQERALFTRRKHTASTTASSDAGDAEPGAYKLHATHADDLDGLIAACAASDMVHAACNAMDQAMAAAAAANGRNHQANGSFEADASPADSSATAVVTAPSTPSSSASSAAHVSAVGKGYARIGYGRQFVILSQRTWKNLYRNPQLMLTHYAISILLGVLSGFLFYGLTSDIPGFQNRLGLFFFVLALFGFSTLTSLSVFSSERLLFVRERANGYYHPVTYFAAKVLFDILPLRILPPILMGAIIYPMTGLVPDLRHFAVFIGVLVLFNLAASGICLFIGIVCKDPGVANLIGSLVMLFSLLFAGLLLNHDKIPPSAVWLQSLSIFHYAFEALIVNEVRYLTLVDHKYGLDITVPGAAILSSFGFTNTALGSDVLSLSVFAAVFIVLAYTAMHVLLVEKR